MKNKIYSLMTKLAAFAFVTAIIANGTASQFGAHQAKEPEMLKKFDK